MWFWKMKNLQFLLFVSFQWEDYFLTKHKKFMNCTFSLICWSVSVTNIEELGSLALIFVCAPCKAGKNVEWSRAGFKHPIRGATSLVIRKYGSYKYIMILFQENLSRLNYCVEKNYSLLFFRIIKLTWYLIYCTWNEAWNVGPATEYFRKHATKAWCSLNGRKADFTNTVAVWKSKDTLHLIVRHQLLNSTYCPVESRAVPIQTTKKKVSYEFRLRNKHQSELLSIFLFNRTWGNPDR